MREPHSEIINSSALLMLCHFAAIDAFLLSVLAVLVVTPEKQTLKWQP